MVAQKITIEPVTRIEGHAKVTIRMKDNGEVEHAYLHVNEFRGFEKFCEGRMVFEMPSITPRICGICPVSHHLAAAKAGDEVFGCPPPRPASLLRELMHMGQIIQSHGMHFFELAGPDLLLGLTPTPTSASWLASFRPTRLWLSRLSTCANLGRKSSIPSVDAAFTPILQFLVGSINPCCRANATPSWQESMMQS